MKFTDIKLIEPIQKVLSKKGYQKPTPIQEKSIPKILEKKDLIGIAQTGTGKTAAFTLPILQLMYNKDKNYGKFPRTLILTPTRELASQIGENIQEYGSFTNFKHTVIFGGVSQINQEKALKKGVDIVIATPGRLLDLMSQGLFNFNTIEHFVLDEADRMLDMGFINDVKKIMVTLPKTRQSLFFSATMSKTIMDLTKRFSNNITKIEVTPEATTVDKIDQGLYFVNKEDKDDLLYNIIKTPDVDSVIVFTKTKHKANKIAKFLCDKGIDSVAIHGNKSQNARTEALDRFKSGKSKALIATDIVARGIDINDISHVINYELPNEAESYVHRIGRTARAGQRGVSYSFCSAEERDYLRDIEKLIRKEVPIINHDKHSEFAKNATGIDAKPPKKKPFVKANKKKKFGDSNNKKTDNKNKSNKKFEGKTKKKFKK